jgi:hypothetical protein
MLDLAGDVDLAVQVGAVDFGDQRLQNRRSGWNFADLDARSKGFGDFIEFRTGMVELETFTTAALPAFSGFWASLPFPEEQPMLRNKSAVAKTMMRHFFIGSPPGFEDSSPRLQVGGPRN